MDSMTPTDPDSSSEARTGVFTGPRRDAAYGRGVLLVMLAGVFWSLGGILVRNVETADEWQILFIRSVSAAATFLTVLLWRYRLGVAGAFARAGGVAVLGGASLSLGFTGFIFAMIHTSIANAVFILSAAPLGAALLAWVLLREPVTRVTWIAAAVAMLGIGVMVAGGVAAGTLFGNLMALLAMAGFCGFATALRAGRGQDMLPAACLAGLFAGGFAGLMASDLSVSLNDAAVCVAMGVVQIGAGMVVFTRGSKHVPAAELALLSLTEVVLAPLWVWIGIGEVPTVATLVGGAIVFAALAWRASLGLRRKPPPFGSV